MAAVGVIAGQVHHAIGVLVQVAVEPVVGAFQPDFAWLLGGPVDLVALRNHYDNGIVEADAFVHKYLPPRDLKVAYRFAAAAKAASFRNRSRPISPRACVANASICSMCCRHWLKYVLGLAPAETQTTIAERECLKKYAAGRRSLVEIGVMHGVNTGLLRSVMDPAGTVTGIDPFPKGRWGCRSRAFGSTSRAATMLSGTGHAASENE
jgi:hypothetical protein